MMKSAVLVILYVFCAITVAMSMYLNVREEDMMYNKKDASSLARGLAINKKVASPIAYRKGIYFPN